MRGLTCGSVDLVVWPEGVVFPIPLDLSDTSEPGSLKKGKLAEIQADFVSLYQSAGLIGAPLSRTRLVARHGLTMEEKLLYNSAILFKRDGQLEIHDKLVMVPFIEGLPAWSDVSWVRQYVLPRLGVTAPFTPGDSFSTLNLGSLSGQDRQVAVSICYESLHPHLPTFDPHNNSDAIMHLVYDGAFREYPEWIEEHLRCCKARSIQTRRWSYVCSASSASCLIDPRGRIVARLAGGPGTLRIDPSHFASTISR